ncbi:MAG TPA: CpaD family pilus assembly lipoprotein [Sphingomicrobium sp.]|nr:CpaD family pilus assembly lipoprotein [Sphingomicrobium sp.]
MRTRIGLLLLASAVAGCSHTPQDLPDRGYAAVNVPVVSRTNYVFDAAAPAGSLSPSEAARLDAWFNSLDLRYGDTIYVDGGYEAARASVAHVAGNYGMLVSSGSPVTAGEVAPGNVRVVVTRTVATVPNCPDWSSRPSQPNYNNRAMPNFGCAVNSNLAAMVANPEDLVHGREGSGVGDAMTASKAVGVYRAAPPTGTKGLTETNTKKGN